MDLELTQIHEYKVFNDTGKAQFHNKKVVTPDNFQKIRVHFVYAVKHDSIPSTTPGAEPPRDARDSGSPRSHSTHLETSSSYRP